MRRNACCLSTEHTLSYKLFRRRQRGFRRSSFFKNVIDEHVYAFLWCRAWSLEWLFHLWTYFCIQLFLGFTSISAQSQVWTRYPLSTNDLWKNTGSWTWRAQVQLYRRTTVKPYHGVSGSWWTTLARYFSYQRQEFVGEEVLFYCTRQDYFKSCF